MQRFVPELVCAKIREERNKRGLKSKDMAELLFKDPSSYSRMERGEGILSFEQDGDKIRITMKDKVVTLEAVA